MDKEERTEDSEDVGEPKQRSLTVEEWIEEMNSEDSLSQYIKQNDS